MDGIHLLGEWFGCPAESPEMIQSDAPRRALQPPARVREHALRRGGLQPGPQGRLKRAGREDHVGSPE
jgi:hypothetical protein